MEILFNGSAKAGQAAGGNFVKDGDTATFVQDVIEPSMKTPVIVDFWAPWCGPCKTLGPLLEKLVNAAGGAVRLVKINVDKNQELAAQMRIQSIPAVYAFKDGQPVDGFVGAVPESQVKALIERMAAGSTAGAGPTTEEILAEAKAILAEGDPAGAMAVFQEVLAQDPTNAPAYAGCLRCLIQAGQIEEAKRRLEKLPEALAGHAEIAAVRTAIELAEQATQAGPAADLRRTLASDADNHQARFDLAMAHYAAGEREAAVDELLELFRRNRAWNEEAARKQLVKLFEAFGRSDPLTQSAQRRLSSLMFS
ncbi:thioredoxin [Telmatospirillum siberiense]|uniref:Thioredoxin n=2 Tax=Telmatospirillum siberiense TaxID=382514 RepID=A0A2N3PT72_9PROT|nr:thioredoxin [Telmatospirillum siberiense]